MGTLAALISITWLAVVPVAVVAMATLAARRRERLAAGPLPAVPVLASCAPSRPPCGERRVRPSRRAVHCPRRVST